MIRSIRGMVIFSKNVCMRSILEKHIDNSLRIYRISKIMAQWLSQTETM